MNWVQENKSLAGILGVMILGALGLGAWLYLSFAEYSASTEEWQQTDSKVHNLREKKLFPNDKNAAAREAEVTDYAAKVGDLRSALLNENVQQPVKPMSQTEFQARLKERATAVVQMAKTADILLPADFALGFADYTNNVPRSPEISAELAVHLDVLEQLVTTFIKAGVKSVDMFERTKVANEDKAPVVAPVVAPPSKAKASTKKSARGSKKPAITEAQAAEPVLDRYPIKVMLTSDQGPFQTIINTLCDPSKMRPFLVVRQLRVENERQEGTSREEIIRKKSGEGLAPDPLNPNAAVNAGKPDAVTIMGEEKLKLYLEIDYIRFRAAPAEEAEAEVSAVLPKP